MALVVAPTPITREIVGVAFKDGLAETDNEGALAYFARLGFKVEEELPSMEWKRDDLVAYATARELSFASDATKAEILEAIEASEEDPS